MSERFFTEKLGNGLMVVGEELPEAESAAVVMMLPVGSVSDPSGREGSANVLFDMLQKGAGNLGVRELSQAFEDHGIQRGCGSGTEAGVVSASMLAEKLPRAIELIGDMVLRPQLPAEELDSIRELVLQDLSALEDEPASKVMVELASHYYPSPWGRSQLGTVESVNALSIEDLRSYHSSRFVPAQSVLAVAGKFEWSEVIRCAEAQFGKWSGRVDMVSAPVLSKTSKYSHVKKETAQVQIALAYPSVSFGHPDYYVAKLAVGVLSGGMSGRLFIEVREKRGLVYRVGASHNAAKGRGAIFAFAGTTPENAAECTQVMIRELSGLANGVTEEELGRAKADLKSRVVMQGELSGSRASGIAHDWWNLGRLRTLDEIKSEIDRVACDDIVRYAGAFPVSPVTLVTLGPSELSDTSFLK